MLAIICKKDSYGYEINKEIEKMTNGQFSFTEATLYTCFKRLISYDYIDSYWKTESSKKRKYYMITPKGKTRLLEMKEEWTFLKIMIDNILENI